MRSGDAQAACKHSAGIGKQRRGFTLVEMLIVVSIVALLVTMAVPVYQKSLIRTRERVLRTNLVTIRKQIDEYVFDKQKGLQSLQDLVTDGYLRTDPGGSHLETGTNQGAGRSIWTKR